MCSYEMEREFITQASIDANIACPNTIETSLGHLDLQRKGVQSTSTVQPDYVKTNHFISMLCTCDIDFPAKVWSKFIDQANITLNLHRPLRADSLTMSAYHQLVV
jgi:hypothetical protein